MDTVSGNLLNTLNLRLDGNQPGLPDNISPLRPVRKNSQSLDGYEPPVLDPAARPLCEAISPGGDFVGIGFENGDLCMFGVDGTTSQLQGHTAPLTSIAFSRDGSRVASGSNDGNVRVWDVQTLLCVANFHASSRLRVLEVNISADGFRVVVLTRPYEHVVSQALGPSELPERFRASVWNIEKGRRLSNQKLPSYHGSLSSLLVNETSLICAFGCYNTLITHDVSTGQRLSTYEGHTTRVSTTTFVPDGSYVISGSKDSTIRVWDTQLNAAPTSSSEHHNGGIRDLSLSADGTKLIVALGDKTVRWWETCSGRSTSKIGRETHIVGFLPDGTAVGLYRGGSTIDVWNAETGETVTTLRGHSIYVEDAAFSPDFTRVVSGSYDSTVRIWNTATWECTAVLEGHMGTVQSVEFLPDGSRVFSGSEDETMRVWDAATGEVLAVLEGHTEYVISARFSSDGRSIVSRDYDGNVRERKAGVDFPLPTSFSLPPVEVDNSGWLFITLPTVHRHRLCWLPVERRGILRLSGHTIALGSTKGVLTILSVSDPGS